MRIITLLFAVSAAVSVVAAHAQETVAVEIAGIVAAGTRIELIKEGFQGTEGPIALPDGDLIFTETQANRITRIAQDGSTSTFLENTNGSNGLGFTADGSLVSVQNVNPRVGIVYPPNRVKVLADKFEGAPFNRPNDLVVDKQGGAYFTDPGARPEPGQAAKPTAVYYVSAAGTVTRIASDVARPNGITLSPDEKVLYLANTDGEHILAYDISAPGAVGPRRDFAKLAGFQRTESGSSSGADGLTVDSAGRLYVASTAGVQIFDSSGKALGVIPLPKAPQNLAFAGPGKKTLYIVGRGSAYRIVTLTQGFAGRAK